MSRAAKLLAIVREENIAIECADLGAWSPHELRAEYDPSGPAIRLNSRVLTHLPPEEVQRFITQAVAHELYHHFERTGMQTRLLSRREREAAAEAFARAAMEE
ncbi:MAG: hypothetical protein JOZ38_02785 [Candidatus Eremiobacteraeota bacterium]|nr:hypothetical protein [Candidatus Eremiobacteraeota bacterium]